MKGIVEFFRRLFGASPTASAATPEKPAPVVSRPAEKVIPNRYEMAQVLRSMINGSIPTRVGPYYQIKETNGNNRSKAIDMIIKAQGGDLGESYCQYGQQEMLDELCRYYDISRKKVRIPGGGSTRSVWDNTPQQYKRAAPDLMRWVTWQHGTSWRGHVGMCFSMSKDGSFQTFEFNTSLVSSGGVVRDGEGASWCDRNTKGSGDMHILGYVDIYAAIVEAMMDKHA